VTKFVKKKNKSLVSTKGLKSSAPHLRYPKKPLILDLHVVKGWKLEKALTNQSSHRPRMDKQRE